MHVILLCFSYSQNRIIDLGCQWIVRISPYSCIQNSSQVSKHDQNLEFVDEKNTLVTSLHMLYRKLETKVISNKNRNIPNIISRINTDNARYTAVSIPRNTS